MWLWRLGPEFITTPRCRVWSIVSSCFSLGPKESKGLKSFTVIQSFLAWPFSVAWVEACWTWRLPGWVQKASFVHFWHSSRGRHWAVIDSVKELGTSVMARWPCPAALSLFLSLSPTLSLSATRKPAKTLGEPACVYHPLNVCHIKSSACHLNAL